MNMKVPAVLLIIILAATAIGIIATDGGGTEGPAPVPPVGPDVPGTDPEPEVPQEDVLPEGYSFDGSTGILSHDGPADWHVFDEYHAYMEPDRSIYGGYDVKSSDSVTLSPGRYTVTSGSNVMDISVPGEVRRTMSWTFDMGGVMHPVSLEFSIPMDLYGPQNSASGEFNGRFGTGILMFHELPKQVYMDSVIEDVESKIASEYVRIGGHTDDRQGYADFLASAAQLAVAYPPRIDYQTDVYVWGVSEYWAAPLETLYHMTGDCDDTAVLLCALYEAAGYRSAVGGHSGHVFAGVHLDSFTETPRSRLTEMGVGLQMKPSSACSVAEINADGTCAVLSDELFHSVETTDGQVPVGYLAGGNDQLGKNTFWGWSGFYTKDTRVV